MRHFGLFPYDGGDGDDDGIDRSPPLIYHDCDGYECYGYVCDSI